MRLTAIIGWGILWYKKKNPAFIKERATEEQEKATAQEELDLR